jgi:hypothetical protein
MAVAERRLKQLKVECQNVLRTVASLRDALQHVTRSGKTSLEEEPHKRNRRLEQE